MALQINHTTMKKMMTLLMFILLFAAAKGQIIVNDKDINTVEGLKYVSPAFENTTLILPIATAIIVALFVGESYGTQRVANFKSHARMKRRTE